MCGDEDSIVDAAEAERKSGQAFAHSWQGSSLQQALCWPMQLQVHWPIMHPGAWRMAHKHAPVVVGERLGHCCTAHPGTARG